MMLLIVIAAGMGRWWSDVAHRYCCRVRCALYREYQSVEFRGTKMLIMEQFPETAASIVSFKVDSDVVSLDRKLHMSVRKSNASRRSLGLGSLAGMTPRLLNLTGAEIYGLSSSRNPTLRGSDFNHSIFYSMMGFLGRLSNFGQTNMYSVQSSRGPTPRPSNFEENCAPGGLTMSSLRFGFYPAQTLPTSYAAPNPEIYSIVAKNIKFSRHRFSCSRHRRGRQ